MTDGITPQERYVRSMVKTLALVSWVLLLGAAMAWTLEMMWDYDLEDQAPVMGWPVVSDVTRTAFFITAMICAGSVALSCGVMWYGKRRAAGAITAMLIACAKILMCAAIPLHIAFAASEAWMVAEYAGPSEIGDVVLLTAMSVVNAGVYTLATTLAVIVFSPVMPPERGTRRLREPEDRTGSEEAGGR